MRSPLQLRPSPSIELAALSLRQVQRENIFRLHLVVWLATSLYLLVINLLTTGLRTPWSLWPMVIWGVFVLLHFYQALVLGRRRYEADHRTLEVHFREAPDDDSELRVKLLEALTGAREALLGTAPEVAEDLTVGETHALTCLAWIEATERLLDRRAGLTVRRQEIVAALSRPGLGSDRRPLETLLIEIDRHEAALVSLTQELDRRRSVLDSFLLALEGAAAAKDRSDMLAAVTGPIRDRLALLKTILETGGPAAVAPAREDRPSGQRIQEEVRLARQLQRSILPDEAPDVPGLSVSHLYQPSSEVGGDFYDFYALGEGRLLVALGDASGHGLDSSMVSSMAKSALYTNVSSGRDLASIMTEMNRMMWDTLGKQRMMTLQLLEIDVRQHRLTWVNAGQVFPLLRTDRGVRELEAPSYPLGVRRHISFEPLSEHLEPGNLLLALTDGYVEALDSGGEPFGWRRLSQRLSTVDRSASETSSLVADLAGSLRRHLGDGPPQDDVTLIAIGLDA